MSAGGARAARAWMLGAALQLAGSALACGALGLLGGAGPQPRLVLLALLAPLPAAARAAPAPAPPRTRLRRLVRLLAPRSLALCCVCALAGYCTVSAHAGPALLRPCARSEGRCLDEAGLFLQLGALWAGTLLALRARAPLAFPHARQERLLEIKAALMEAVVAGFRESAAPTLSYALFYVLWGRRARHVVCDVYSLYPEDPPLDGIFNLLVSGVWLRLWLHLSFFFVSMRAMKAIFDTTLTDPMKFPITSSSLTLHEALGRRTELTGILAADDFRRLATTDPARRLEIFTLSQPGGHPHNWNNVLRQCLETIDLFSKDLESINNNSEPSEATSPSNSAHIGYNFHNMRNMAMSPELQTLKDHNRNKVDDTFADAVKAEFYMCLNKLCQKPGISFFFGELMDAKLKSVLMRAQPVMWTCEGLAFISAASLNEDRYGIVQNDLPVIIGALVGLKQGLEKLSKSGLIPKKHTSDVFTIKMKSALMSSLKRSIYKIVVTFSKYINDIPLSPELQHAIQPFRTFKEG